MKKFLFLKKAEFSHSKNDLVLFNFIFNLKRLSKGISKLFLVLTLLLAILFCKNNSYAQTEPVFSKKSSWSVIRTHYEGNIIYSINNYKLDGDTIIEGKTYSKVFRDNNYYLALRETEDHKIYCYIPAGYEVNDEILIYDFDWYPNKTLYHQSAYNYCFNQGEWPNCVQTILGNTIDSILLLDGKYYQCSGNNGNPLYIRGIGCTLGFFFETFGDVLSIIPRLLCFYIDDELVYLNPNYDDCSTIVNISGIVKNNGVSLAGVGISYSINSNLVQDIKYTNGNGYYSILVPKHSNITITAYKAGYEFEPQTIELFDITQDTANNNFTTILPEPIKYTVSGTVKIDETTPLEDVTISYTGGYEQTDQYGYYEFEAEENSEIIITPTFSGFSFYPTSDTIIVTNNTTVDFNAIEQIIKYTVSGTVKIDETTPLEDVTISYTGGYEQTDQYGYYEFEVEENSEIIITPTFSGFSFYPTSDTIIVTNNTTVNFNAYTIGISQLQNTNSELQVYPNPTTRQITVQTGRTSSPLDNASSLQIYDITGRIVETQFIVPQRNAKENELTIDISHLQNGVYFLKIENQIFKIIKN